MPSKRRLLRVPWTARRSNQSVLKEINPEYSLERLKAEGRGQLRIRWLDGSIDMSLSKVLEIVKYMESWHAAVHGVAKSDLMTIYASH